MKSVIMVIGLLIMPLVSFSQATPEEVDLYQSIFGMEKRAMYENFLQLEGEAATGFWSLYDEYEEKRKAYGKDRLKLLNDYAENYSSLTDEKTDQLVADAIALNNNLNKIIAQYHKKIRKVAGSKVAAQFYQLDNYVLGSIRIEMMEAIPFIGELEG